MPVYRTPMGMVHMKGTKLPPPCAATMWLDGKEVRCAAMSAFQCDYPDGGGYTCDRHLCAAHAREIGPNQHLCPEHHDDHVKAQGQRSLFTHLVAP